MSSTWRERGRADTGSATIWAVGALAALVALVVLVLQLGSAVSTRHRAESAADLAALAVAAHALEGPDAACARAKVVTTGMAAVLVRCELDGWDAVVEIEVGSGLGAAHGRARAGPVQVAPLPPGHPGALTASRAAAAPPRNRPG